MLTRLRVSNLGGNDEFRDEMVQFSKDINRIVGAASKGFKHKGKFRWAVSALSWAAYYKNKKSKGETQGQLFLNLLDSNIFDRLRALEDTSLVKWMTKKGLEEIELEHKLYIPIHRPDMLTPENLFSKDLPQLAGGDQDVPFLLEKQDAEDAVKIRMSSPVEWMGVNWKDGSKVDGMRHHARNVII